MSVEEMVGAIEDLINSDGAIDIPGLSLEPVVNNYIETRYAKQLSECETEQDRENMKTSLSQYYLEGDGKVMMQMEIANIKAQFSAAKDSLKSIGTSITQTVATNAIPSVITTGAATSVPNPAYALLENAQKKAALEATLKQVSNQMVDLLKSAVKIAFPIPDVIGAVITTLKTTKQALNAIPV